MNEKIDYYLGAFVGFLTGVFLIPTVYNLGVNSKAVLLVLPLVVPVLFIFGVWLGRALGKISKLFFVPQFSRFVAVGFLNTAIDFGMLNILSRTSGVHSGLFLGSINIPGFVLAVGNSYIWNKIWVFHDRDKENFLKDFPKFLAVTLVGLIINSGLIIFITAYTPAANTGLWLNIAKASATVVTLVWNFLGFKLIVFNRSNT